MINPENLNCAYMEEQGFALGVIPVARPNLVILRQEDTWVAFDEAGLEMARHDNYWLLRRIYLEYGQLLNMTRLPASGDVWKHHKGIEYTVDKLTNQFSDYLEYQTQVVYYGENGKVWSKGLGDFIEKMTFVSAAPEQVCEPVEDAPLGIIGFMPGTTWPGSEKEDTTPQGDIHIQYSKESRLCNSSDGTWNGAIIINGKNESHVEDLRALVIAGLRRVLGPDRNVTSPVPVLRDSLEFEGLLAKYHAEVWQAAEGDEEGPLQDFDMAGVDLAKQLIAAYRGEAVYTHHNDLQAAQHPYDLTEYAVDQWWFQELAKVSLGVPVWDNLLRACTVARNLARLVLPAVPGDQKFYPAPVCGLPAGEVPQLLEKGERVLPLPIESEENLPPLIVKLHGAGQQIAEQAFDAQEATHAALATRPKPPCTECKGSGGSWLAGAPAHPDNWTECDTCKGKGTK